MPENKSLKYAIPELLQLTLPSRVSAGLSNLNDPRDTREGDDEWIKYEDTDEEL